MTNDPKDDPKNRDTGGKQGTAELWTEPHRRSRQIGRHDKVAPPGGRND
ncbi:MAG: hypothetical protein HXX10_01820 [Rhodoplanes sp.]|nr:hypothetical protein [Rhodoplanes sp.]NVO12752.1 hypothetical protein [Rhodoplanes sp.]